MPVQTFCASCSLIITKADVDDFIFRLENVLKTIHN